MILWNLEFGKWGQELNISSVSIIWSQHRKERERERGSWSHSTTQKGWGRKFTRYFCKLLQNWKESHAFVNYLNCMFHRASPRTLWTSISSREGTQRFCPSPSWWTNDFTREHLWEHVQHSGSCITEGSSGKLSVHHLTHVTAEKGMVFGASWVPSSLHEGMLSVPVSISVITASLMLHSKGHIQCCRASCTYVKIGTPPPPE